jgi:methionyl-tRNA synthetase
MLNARADDFIRTTEERHQDSVQEIWRRMAANGDIYLSKYAGWYSVRDEAYYAEDETKARRPPFATAPQHAGRMGGGGELLLPLSAYQDRC